MTYTTEQQEKYRKDYTESAKQKAWDILCQLAYIREHELPTLEATHKEHTDHLTILEGKLKEAEDAVDAVYTREGKEKARALEQEVIRQNAKIDGVQGKSSGSATQLSQLYALVVEKEAEAERYIRIAEHARTWELKEVETKL